MAKARELRTWTCGRLRSRVAEIEQALCQVAEIKAARVVTSPDGVIQEIHVLALPTQVAQAARARHRVDDHGELRHPGRPQEDLDRAARPGRHAEGPRPAGAEPRPASSRSTARSPACTPPSPSSSSSRASRYIGEATGAASQTGRLRLVAEATLNAVEQYARGLDSFALEDVAIVQLGRERVAVCCMALVTPLGEQTFAGSALVRQNENDSIVKATLDAINRRMGFLTTT